MAYIINRLQKIKKNDPYVINSFQLKFFMHAVQDVTGNQRDLKT